MAEPWVSDDSHGLQEIPSSHLTRVSEDILLSEDKKRRTSRVLSWTFYLTHTFLPCLSCGHSSHLSPCIAHSSPHHSLPCLSLSSDQRAIISEVKIDAQEFHPPQQTHPVRAERKRPRIRSHTWSVTSLPRSIAESSFYLALLCLVWSQLMLRYHP